MQKNEMRLKKVLAGMVTATMVLTSLAGCASASKEVAQVESKVEEAVQDKVEAVSEAAKAAPELELIVAHNQTSLENPYAFGTIKFKEVVEEKSGGKIAVTLHHGTLGESESELIEKLQLGAANMVVASPGFMTSIGVPEVDMFSLLYLFDSFAHWEKSLDGEFGNAMKDVVKEKTGNQFKIMGYWSSSVRDFYGKKAVSSVEDVKGLTIRTQSSKVQQDFWKEAGAIPTSIAWGELYQALQQGVVDSAENDYTNLMLKEHHKTENGKFISETHHDYTTRLFLMDGNFYDKLTDEQKTWIDEAVVEATKEERAVIYKMFEESKKKVVEDGATVVEHADIDIDAFKEIAVKIQDDFAKANKMENYLEMVRKEMN